MATPIDAATRRLGSLVADSAMTANTTCPGFMSERPSSRSTSSQWGGKIELTRTRLKLARCASRSAISKRSEEHTSELQSPYDLVCRLLLEKKKKKNTKTRNPMPPSPN